MQLLSYDNPAHQSLLRGIDDRFPFPFLKAYADFYREYYRHEMHLLYSHEFEAFLPFRIIRAKLATLGQIFHAPFKRYEELVPKDQLIFFNMMLRFIRKTRLCDRLLQPYPFVVLSAMPPNVQSCEFGTYVIDLKNQSPEEIFNQFSPKYKRAVKHSEKHHACVEASWEVFDDFYLAYCNTMQRVGMPTEPESYFRNLFRYLGPRNTVPAVVYEGTRPLGSAFFIYTQYSAYCTHAGSLDGSKLYGAMKLLHYHMIRYMKERNVSRYDLVGVRLRNTDPSLEGIFRFKKGFGGDLRSGYLWKTDISPLRTRLYDSALVLRHLRKPAKDIIDQSKNQ